MKLFALTVCILLSASAIGQISPEDAKAKLDEKMAEKKVERERIVQITAGELADLHARIAQLEAQLKSQTAAAPSKKVYKEIEIGMTHDELINFVNHSPMLKISSMHADTGKSKATQNTVRRTTANREGKPQSQDSSESVEVVKSTGKRESFEIIRYQNVTEAGKTQKMVSGYLMVFLEDGSVTSVTSN